MGRWINRPFNTKYKPKIAEYEVTNEDEDGYPYTECNYIFIKDIPEQYKEEFMEYIYSHNMHIVVEKKEEREKNIISTDGVKIAVNSIDWEKWYKKYGIRMK